MLVPDPAMPTGERVKILDFGLAKLSEVHEAANVKTNSQAVLGTPLYMSPEQCEGAGRIDSKTDVYSLGCMLYELLSGKPPFVGTGPGQVIGMHLFMEPEPLGQRAPAVPAPVAELIGKLLIKNKEQRPSMREVQRALELLAADLPPPPRREEGAEHAESDGELDPAKQAALALAPTMGSGPGEAKGTATTDRAQQAAAALVATLSADLSAPPAPQPVEPKNPIAPVVSSTLGRSAAEKVVEPPRRRLGLWAAGGLAVLGVGGGLLLLPHKQPPPASAVEVKVAPAAPQPPPRKTVRLQVLSKPAGAAVVRAADKTVLGVTPWLHEQDAQEGTLTVILQAPGYLNQQTSLSLSTGGVADLTMLAAEPPASSEPPATGPRSKRRTKAHAVAQPKQDGPVSAAGSPAATAAAPPAAKSPDPVAPAPPAKVPEKSRARPLPIED
jgi:serine/threonine-protein kinase